MQGTNQISRNIYLFYTKKFASHTYLIKDKFLTLIDPGTPLSFKELKRGLAKLNIKIEDIKIILNTHEHFDHILSNKYFKNAVIMVHKETAKKIKNCIGLEDDSEIKLGKTILKLIYTPGHSKSSVCFYEPRQKILFSGDTVFAHGTPSLITYSKKEYILSLKKLLKLKIDKILPGHGDISLNPKEDIRKILKK